jgi:MSHA biogenesis protein MshJ
MKLPAGIENAFTRFDRMSIRERGLIAFATLAVMIMAWTVVSYDPIRAREGALGGEIESLDQSMAANTQTVNDVVTGDPASLALQKETKLRKELAEINAKLASKSGGLIEPERMVKVIQDVLARQRGVTLISLHNKPVTMLTPPKPASIAIDAHAAAIDSPIATPESEQAAAEQAANANGPYVHPVELVIEGQYLDILAYLHALETLEWRFYWKLLELETTRYPTNRVRIELNTLSMDKNWIGV